MSIIEEAAQRLAQLRKAGVDVPAREAGEGSSLAEATKARAPTPERLAQALEAKCEPEMVESKPVATKPPALSKLGTTRMDSGRRSKAVEIDLQALAAAGYLTPEAQRSQLADDFRVVKRPIIRNAQGQAGTVVERANRVMVTSALPREGKSFVSLNLAMSIASEVDSTVLLVDADVANPSLMKRLRLQEGMGLLDLLTNKEMDVADVLLRTNVDKLTLLPAGTSDRRATEMLASSAMAELVEEMASRYPDRILVFDSPPLLATTEARVLATHMGQIVMVVEADQTTQVAVKQALETIENCPVVLMVLNKVAQSKVGGYYGYAGYGAGYGAAGVASAASGAK
jgi:exopolysaccharide/PEP-CTERM locus tyrosine autokinase